MRYRTLSAIAALMNELTFFYNAFILFAFVKTRTIMYIDYWPWALGGAAILLWNRRFLKKARTLVSIVAANALLVSLWLLLGFRYFFHVQGLTAYGFAAAFLMATTVRAAYLSNHEIPDRHMVTYTEVCIIGTGFFFLIQTEPFLLPMYYIIPSLAVVLLNILSLINMRLFSEDVKNIDISKLRGGLFLTAAFGVITGGIAAVLTFVSAPFRAFAIQVISAVKDIIVRIFLFLSWLLSLLDKLFKPKGNYEEEPMKFKFKIPKLNERGPLNTEFIRFIPWILILLTLAVLVYLFVKHRKIAFKKYKVYGTVRQRGIKRDFALWGKLKSYMKALYREMHLFYLSIRMRHTPQGMFLIIERWGRRKGFLRKICETPGAYLKRLMNSSAWDKEFGEADVTKLVQCLVKELEWKYYTKGRDFKRLNLISKAELKVLSPYFQTGLWHRLKRRQTELIKRVTGYKG